MWRPTASHVVVSLAVLENSWVRSDCRGEIECTAKPKPTGTQASGKLFTRLFVRHWDTWADGTDNHLFSIETDANGVASGKPVELMSKFDGDVPGKPSSATRATSRSRRRAMR